MVSFLTAIQPPHGHVKYKAEVPDSLISFLTEAAYGTMNTKHELQLSDQFVSNTMERKLPYSDSVWAIKTSTTKNKNTST